jgi:hypothetical protein
MCFSRHFVWLLPAYSAVAFAADVSGFVRDGNTNRPIPDAIVTLNDTEVRTAEDGSFRISGEVSSTVLARAIGYNRTAIALSRTPQPVNIALKRFAPKALYLTVYGVGAPQFRDNALHLIDTTELNSLVIDLKGDAGIVPWPARTPLATETGARKKLTSIPDLADFVSRMHARGIYLIARIVVFKDNPLALCHPELAVKTASGAIWRDREGLAWVDPFRQEVRDYNLSLASEAAQAGFDEVQFDYVRFPDAKGLRFSEESTAQSRERAIKLLFEQARKRLARYNVFIAGDIFGYVCWNENDTGIGQLIEQIVPVLDYTSPMLYPSGFQFGIPGYKNPVAHPFEMVKLSLTRALERTHLTPTRFRPWLQAFRDYAFDRRIFGAEEIKDQIRAAEQFGSDGWMLWNARNQYSGAGLDPKK